jgi:cytochrome c-type biogenesis protein CcmH/NrfF
LKWSRKITLGFLLLFAPAVLAADRDHVRNVGGRLICVCGCKQILASCNHFNCPTSGPMMAELEKMIDQGINDDAIVAAFVSKYGKTVLAAPPTSGFDLTAWVMPVIAFATGILVVIYVERRWRRQTTRLESSGPVDVSKYQGRVEEELEKFTPED